MATRAIQESISIAGQDSPLERAKRLVAPMCRQPKEAHWLGVRMENFLRAYGKRIEAVGVEDVCDYPRQECSLAAQILGGRKASVPRRGCRQ